MTNQSAQPITEKELAEKLESISASMLGLDKKEAWTRVAREAAELMGYEFTPEKPRPGTWHIVKDGPQVGDAARVDEDGYLHVIGSNGKTLRDIHPDNTWPDLTPARIVPVTTPVTLTEEEVGELWDEYRVEVTSPWRSWGVAPRVSVTRTANAILAKHAAPAEGELIASAAKPIDPDDVRVGDRVRLVLRNGEATFIVANAYNNSLHSTTNTYYERDITAAYLLGREGEG